MNSRSTLAFVLVVALLVTAVTPARAEAVEPLTILAIAGVAVAVVIIVAYLIVANVHEYRQPSALAPEEPLVVVASSRQANAESP